jgi:glycosidase
MVTENLELQSYLIRAYQYVIARFDVDGFRIDTLRYLHGNLAQTFGNAIREFALSIGKKNFFTFGEVLDSSVEQDIARFVGRNTTSSDDPNSLVGVDAALDYPLFNSLKSVIKGFAAPSAVINMYQYRKQVERYILSSHGDATRYFVTFVDNHDMKERVRYEAPGNPTQYDPQVSLAIASLYGLPGIPRLLRHRAGPAWCGQRSGRSRGAVGYCTELPADDVFFCATSEGSRRARRDAGFALRPLLFPPHLR